MMKNKKLYYTNILPFFVWLSLYFTNVLKGNLLFNMKQYYIRKSDNMKKLSECDVRKL